MDTEKTRSRTGKTCRCTSGTKPREQRGFTDLYREVLEEFVEAQSIAYEDAWEAMEIWRQKRIADDQVCAECGRAFRPGGHRAPRPRKCADCKIEKYNSRRYDPVLGVHYWKNHEADNSE